MAKYPFRSIKSIVEDWLDFSGEDHAELDEPLILKWANDAIERISSGEQLIQRIALLKIEDYRAMLPVGFKYIAHAAYRDNEDTECVKKKLVERISEASIDLIGDCKLVYKDNDPNFLVEVDVNDVYEGANPKIYAAYMKHFCGSGSTHDRLGKRFPFHNGFRLMRKTSNGFYNIPYHINDCSNFNLDCEVEYNIVPGVDGQLMMTSNQKEADVLISYLGTQLDDEGYRMIPDVEIAYKTINLYIEERLAYRDYRRTKEQRHRMFWHDLKADVEKFIARTRSQIQTPDPDEWTQWVRNNWLKIVPGWDSQAQFGRRTDDRFQYPDQTGGLINHGRNKGGSTPWRF